MMSVKIKVDTNSLEFDPESEIVQCCVWYL